MPREDIKAIQGPLSKKNTSFNFKQFTKLIGFFDPPSQEITQNPFQEIDLRAKIDSEKMFKSIVPS